MSNIIKHWGSKENSGGTVIDSNPKADAFLSELLRLRREKEEREALKNMGEEKDGGNGFKAMNLKKASRAVDYARLEEEARQKAEQIIEEANATKEMILAQALEEAKRVQEELRFTASEQGYQEGYEKAIGKIERKEKELEEERKRLREEFDEEVRNLEPKFADLVIKYVEKLTGILADEYESVIYNILALGITNSEPSKNYIIHVPKEQYKYVSSKEDYIREVAGEQARVEIMSDSNLKVNSCKIETDNCVIDTGLDTRLMMLVNSIRLLSERD